MPVSKRIAVIGAGSSGLTAIKSCKEEGLEPVCFEKTDNFGGLWRYRDKDINGTASVMKSTIINTSKEMSAYTDFPPPKEFPNYMHNSLMMKYFDMYAENFDLLRHVKVNHEVLKVVQAKDYHDTGRWAVTVRNTLDNASWEEVFDGVMVCIGHHVFPNVPTFSGLIQFKGSVIHTHSLKKPTGYEDKKVVVIGIGNSAVDAVVDISNVAEKVYLSTRRGSWIARRVGENGFPSDILGKRRSKMLLPVSFRYSMTEKALNNVFDHDTYSLKPCHSLYNQHPTDNDAIPNKILSGVVVVKGDVTRFVEDGVVFEGEKERTKIDAVVLATGYRIVFPFLDSSILHIKDNRVHLYKYVFPPQLQHPTLAIIGLVQQIGAIFPLAEMQSRWFALLMNKKLRLPSKATMMEDITLKNETNARRYVNSPRHTIQVDWIPYMDELAGLIGAKPNLAWLALSDPKLFWTCFTGPCLPYQYRLNGPHPWPGAREAILEWEERVKCPLQTRHVYSKMSEDGFSFTVVWLVCLAVLFTMLWKLFSKLSAMSALNSNFY